MKIDLKCIQLLGCLLWVCSFDRSLLLINVSYFLCPISGLILHGSISPRKATRKKKGWMEERQNDRRKEGEGNCWLFRLLVAYRKIASQQKTVWAAVWTGINSFGIVGLYHITLIQRRELQGPGEGSDLRSCKTRVWLLLLSGSLDE